MSRAFLAAFLAAGLAAFALPFVFALRYPRRLFYTFIAGSLVCWGIGGDGPKWLAEVLWVAALMVASLNLGATLERTRHR